MSRSREPPNLLTYTPSLFVNMTVSSVGGKRVGRRGERRADPIRFVREQIVSPLHFSTGSKNVRGGGVSHVVAGRMRRKRSKPRPPPIIMTVTTLATLGGHKMRVLQ